MSEPYLYTTYEELLAPVLSGAGHDAGMNFDAGCQCLSHAPHVEDALEFSLCHDSDLNPLEESKSMLAVIFPPSLPMYSPSRASHPPIAREREPLCNLRPGVNSDIADHSRMMNTIASPWFFPESYKSAGKRKAREDDNLEVYINGTSKRLAPMPNFLRGTSAASSRNPLGHPVAERSCLGSSSSPSPCPTLERFKFTMALDNVSPSPSPSSSLATTPDAYGTLSYIMEPVQYVTHLSD